MQPLYLKAEKGELPELKRVIVSTGGRVAWGENFGAALEKLMGRKVATSAAPKAKAAEAPDIKSLAREAALLYDEAISAQKNGEWAAYGEKIKKLGEVLSKLKGPEE